jgi:hypothetical protein
MRQHTSACVSIRQHMSAYVSIRQAYVSIRQHTSAYVSIRQHTSAYVSIRQHTSAYGVAACKEGDRCERARAQKSLVLVSRTIPEMLALACADVR